MGKIVPAWYILNYHNVSWGTSTFENSVGGSFSPQEFAEHIAALSQEFEFVGIFEGLQKWRKDQINCPILSFWFDDGFVGTRLNALPILNHYNITAGMSINSGFVFRTEVFWRFQISYLLQSPQKNRLHRLLVNKFHYFPTTSVMAFCLDNFSSELYEEISKLFYESASDDDIAQVHSLFDTVSGLMILQKNGWLLANHSARHFPIAEDSAYEFFTSEFQTSEAKLSDVLNIQRDFLVLPFDRPGKRTKILKGGGQGNTYLTSKTIVGVGNKYNANGSQKSWINRISVNEYSVRKLLGAIGKIGKWR